MKDLLTRFRNRSFESSCGPTQEWRAFGRAMHATLKRIAGADYTVAFQRGHFYFSAFFTNRRTGRLAYLLSGDTRCGGRNTWETKLIIWAASSDTDYTGGPRHWCRLDQVRSWLDTLTQEVAA